MKLGNTLDLGCGNGKEAIFVNEQGFEVVGVDESEAAKTIFDQRVQEAGLTNISSVCSDVHEYTKSATVGEWANIYSFLTIHFLNREKGRSIYEWIKKHTESGGLNLMHDFTNEGAMEIEGSNGYYFDRGELLSLYSDWKLLFYCEKPVKTKQGGFHMCASIVAQKP